MNKARPGVYVGTKIPQEIYNAIVNKLVGTNGSIKDVIIESLWDWLAKERK